MSNCKFFTKTMLINKIKKKVVIIYTLPHLDKA